jgi:hypothetical protein
MTKRLLKRHKRQVSRAKTKVRLSAPDLRTPEQVKAAREASRPPGGRRNEPVPLYSTGSGANNARTGPDWAETAAKNKETV